MTPDEQKMLSELADKISQTPAPPRDPEAEELIRTRIGKRPDALYLMTQTVLIQNMALQQAQKQIQDLQQSRPANSAGSGSFLGQSAAPPSWQQQQPQYASSPQYAQPQAMPNAGGAPSFLKGAAQTAAGVAAGALAFEGIRSLFSHPGYGMSGEGFGGFGGGGLGGFGGGGFGGRPMEETVVNNYYDSPGSNTTDNMQLDDNRDTLAGTGTDGGYDDASLSDSSNFDTADDGGSFDDSGDDFA